MLSDKYLIYINTIIIYTLIEQINLVETLASTGANTLGILLISRVKF